jgi:hypothetical protein
LLHSHRAERFWKSENIADDVDGGEVIICKVKAAYTVTVTVVDKNIISTYTEYLDSCSK